MTTTKNVPAFIQSLQTLQDSLRIINGPGKFDLMNSLFDLHRTVFFEIQLVGGAVEKVEFTVRAIGKEDGSGESWLLRIAPINSSSSIPLIKAYYSSKRRTGVIGTVADHRHLY